jgi:hypothetical protein
LHSGKKEAKGLEDKANMQGYLYNSLTGLKQILSPNKA